MHPTQGIAGALTLEGTITAVSCDPQHRFSKPTVAKITLIAGHGIEGDAHAGRYVKHRYLAKRDPMMPNLRQVLLIATELFDEMSARGYAVHAGELGENITTRGLDLASLPLGALLHLGKTAIVEVTGVRTPCFNIDTFQKGLKKQLIERRADGSLAYKAGILGVVRAGGDVSPDDSIRAELPEEPWKALPAL